MTDSRNLDFLRSVAVLLVLFDHLFMAAGLADRYPFVWSMGHLGVLMFFVHTSLVLMLSLERSEEKSSGHLFRDFYIRRAFRIYPLSIACVVLVSAFGVPQTPGIAPAHRGAAVILASLFLVQNLAGQLSVISPMWSLPLEIQMYAVLPFLFIFAKRHSVKGLLKVWCAAIVMGLIFDWVLGMNLVRGVGRLDILAYVPCFVAGIISYRLSKNRIPTISWVLWPVALAAIVVVYVSWQALFPGSSSNPFPPYRGWFVCAILGGIIPYFREVTPTWLRTASHYVAKYSFGIYLGQVPALWIAFTFLPQSAGALRWIVSILLLAFIAVVGYHLIEQPGMLLGKLMVDRSKGRKPRVATLVAGA
jgi:peptidoglycan/LPS O-acetylase OafA/YrhL